MIIHLMVLITEIMFDPDPAVGLPAYEYAELHNAGTDPVDLTGWRWVTGSTTQTVKLIRKGRITPGGYILLCSAQAATFFRNYGEVADIESFPALRNTGDRLALLDREGRLVHTVLYSPDLYQDAIKANGGWSLELADLSRPCTEAAWRPSCDPSGGTPGRANSVNLDLPDEEPPRLLRAALHSDQLFFLLFSSPLAPQGPSTGLFCRLEPGGWVTDAALPPYYGYPGLFFRLPAGLDPEQVYQLHLLGEVHDCSGQVSEAHPVPLAFPKPAEAGDLVITEILFDPLPGQVEFVELLNCSTHTVELLGLILARADPGGKVVAWSDEQETPFILLPGAYAVMTASGRQFGAAWPGADPSKVAVRPDLPALVNSHARLILLTVAGDTIDQAAYDPDWHYPYLGSTKGVSLERIDLQRSGLERSNWFSASGATGGATPGSPGSSQTGLSSEGDDPFEVIRTGWSLEGSKNDAVVGIKYRFDEPGWFANVAVYHSGGKPVRILYPFNLLGQEGLLLWDGLDEQGRRVAEGIYLLVADYVHPSGRKGRWKGACGVRGGY